MAWENVVGGIGMGLAQGTGNIANMYMKGMELQANKQTAADRMDIMNRELQMKEKAFNYEQEKRDQEKKLRSLVRPVSEIMPDIRQSPAKRQFLVDTAKSLGYDNINVTADGDIHAPNEVIEVVTNIFAKDTDRRLGILKAQEVDTQAKIKGLEQKSLELTEKIMAAQDTGKTEEVAKLQAQQKQLSSAMSGYFTSTAELQKILEIEKAKVKPTTPDMATIYGPNGETQRVAIPKSGVYIPPDKWSLTAPDKSKLLTPEEEAQQIKLRRAGASNVNITTGTQTQLQKDVIEQQTALDTLGSIEKLTKDEYLTYAGRGKQYVAKVGEKLGASVVDEKWLNDRQQWYQVTKGAALAYRKWVTGVAGGEKEMNEIAKSYPDPDKNSPTEFKANLKQAKINAARLKKRYNMFLATGVTPTKKQLSSVPLSSIPVTESDVLGTPAVGDIRDGYRYIGGPINQESSWSEVTE